MDDVNEHLRARVRYGVLSRAWINEESIDYAMPRLVEDELGKADAAVVAELSAFARSMLAALTADQATWTEPTVNDRIDAAFEELDEAGIVALQNAGYTMSEGWGDANHMATERLEDGTRSRGAVFYHGQDTERAIDGGTLFLAFGAYAAADVEADALETDGAAELDAASLEIGREIVRTLEKHGIAVTWPGTIDARIEIAPFTWRRRFAT